MITGSIGLLIKGRRLSTRRYCHKWRARKIIEEWIKMYSLKDGTYELIIFPDEIKTDKSIYHHAKLINQKYHGKDREQNTDGGTETDAESIGHH